MSHFPDQNMQVGENPYASPVSQYTGMAQPAKPIDTSGIWREGDQLIAINGAQFPPLCVKCNAPATKMVRKKFAWHNPILLITILAGVLVYAILVLVLQKQATVTYGICDQHRARRRNYLLVFWLIVFPIIAGLFVCGFIFERIELVLLMPIALIVLGIVFANLVRILAPKKINDTHGWYKGASQAFLNNFPHV